MDDRDFKRVFDQVKLSPERQEAMLEHLLDGEKRRKGIKPMKKTVVVLVAAALMLMACAFTVVSGLDERIINYLESGKEKEALIAQSWSQVNESHTYDNGWTVEVKQILSDRYSAVILTDVIVPEEDMPQEGEKLLGLEMNLRFLDGDHRDSGGGTVVVYDPRDNDDLDDRRFSMLLKASMMAGRGDFTGRQVELIPERIVRSPGDPIQLSDEWSCTVTLPESDPGQTFSVEEDLKIKTETISQWEVYLSPIHLAVTLHGPTNSIRECVTWPFDPEKNVSVTLSDGRTIPMSYGGVRDDWHMNYDEEKGNPEESEGLMVFSPEEFLDPAEVISVTILGQTFSLDGLTPVEG